jgi:hypothetical protein
MMVEPSSKLNGRLQIEYIDARLLLKAGVELAFPV